MSRLPNLDDLRKKWLIRMRIWIIWLIAMLLTDEYIKEGYFFNIHDVIIPGTHEFIISILIIIFIFANIYSKNKE